MAVQAQKIKIPKAKSCNPWMHAFRLGLWQNAAVTVVAMVLFLLLYTALPAAQLIIDSTNPGPLGPSYGYLYIVGSASLFFPVLALASALLQGVLSFRFLHRRKSSIAWFSLGLSRNELFWSRFTAGAAGALLPVVVSLTVTLGFNLALSPTVGLILARYAFFLIGMCLQILVLYSVTVAVCTHVATGAEAAVYSFTLCLLPSVVIVSLNAMMDRLLFGTPYIKADYYPSGLDYTLLRTLSDWNPFLFMGPYMSWFGGGSRIQNADPWEAKRVAMVQPSSVNWLIPLAWVVAVAAIILLARWLFLRRKPETAGRMGAGRALGALCALTAGIAAFGVVYSLPFYLPKELAFLAPLGAACGLALVVMLATALPLRLFRRPRWHGFATVFGGLAAMAALAGIFATGGLGYSNFVPEPGNVKSVTVTYKGLNGFIEEYELEQDGLMPGWSGITPCVTLTDSGDICMVTDIHRKLASSGRLAAEAPTSQSPTEYNETVKIRYTMNSGAVVARTYRSLTADLVKGVIALDDTAGVKQAYAKSLLNPPNDPTLDDIAAYASGTLYLCSPFCSAISPLELSSGERAEMLQCIAHDLAVQPSTDRYLSDSPPICVVELVPTERHEKIEDLIAMNGTKPVYVTRRFSETLAFLNSHSIKIPEENAEHISIYGYTNSYVPFDKGNYSMPIYTTQYIWKENAVELEQRGGTMQMISDSVQMQDILSRCRSVYLISEGGYPVLIKLKDSDQYVTAFLPDSAAPDFVKDDVK